ncbi:uncharacterized protein LOC111280251 [Durio zibethinus]|uniref:Uncharacterized protein LOC111280251 n=1 Tax=Durio zibethinus TaxID=66656 RepID=A0A6P5X4A7_DURZI|nr:uncharacterized protein LOC111280251 [Durio zibethinus]
MPSVPRRPLILYLMVHEKSMGCVLGQHDETGRKEQAIITWAKDPIKYIFEKPSLSGRIARWQVLLYEYDIVYVSQKVIKRRAITKFLTKHAPKDYVPMTFDFPMKTYCLYFLISLEGDYYPITAKLNSDCTNNVTKYEACLLGLQVAFERKAHALKVYGDSALVIYQFRGE